MDIRNINLNYINKLKRASARKGLYVGEKKIALTTTKVNTPRNLFDLAKERINGIANKRHIIKLLREFSYVHIDKTGNNLFFELDFRNEDVIKSSPYLLQWYKILGMCISESGFIYNKVNYKYTVSMKDPQNVSNYKILQGSIAFSTKYKVPTQEDLIRWESLSQTIPQTTNEVVR